MHMGVDEESALRDFVTEINERVTVHVFIQDGQNRMQDERDTDSARTSLASSTFEEENGETETARVIFPEYYGGKYARQDHGIQYPRCRAEVSLLF